MMKIKPIIMALVIFCTSISFSATTNVDISKEAVDAIKKSESRFLQYSMDFKLTQYKNNQKRDEALFKLIISNEGTIAYYKKPIVNKGKIILQKEGSYFLYFPKPKHYIRVSARSNLFGNVSYGDLIKPPLSAFYTVVSTEVLMTNKEHIVNIHYHVKKGIQNIPYHKKTVRFNYTKKRIETIESYSRNNILLGKIINLEFSLINGTNFATKVKILDTRHTQNYAIQKNSGFKKTNYSLHIFNPSYLKKIKSLIRL